MSYAIEAIEGIGPAYAKKLRASGIRTTKNLLSHCASRSGRKQAAKECGIEEKRLLAWANMADLMRINGVGKQFAELLEAAGVDTVKELKQRKPENLAQAMQETNAKKRLTRQAPSASRVTRWVAEAKQLSPMISH